MTHRDLIDDLRSRINPAYPAQLGTESYERRLCAEALEELLADGEKLRNDITRLLTQRDYLLSAVRSTLDENGHLADIEEGCTPADARVLREANHALAEENARLREGAELKGKVAALAAPA